MWKTISCLVGILGILTTALAQNAGATPERGYPVAYGQSSAINAALSDWNGNPPGANDWSCQPTAEHPDPVVLIPSVVESAALNWHTVAPYLKNDGYCVFAINYGRTPYIAPGLNGLGNLRNAAGELARFVAKVRAISGAKKVDLVGHVQGGLVGRFYIQLLGGADSVSRVALLSSPLTNDLADKIRTLGLPKSFFDSVETVIPPGLMHGNPYAWENLNDDHNGLHPGIQYTEITSRADEFYAFGAYALPPQPNARLALVEDYCASERPTQLAIPYSKTAVALIGRALNPNQDKPISCS